MLQKEVWEMANSRSIVLMAALAACVPAAAHAGLVFGGGPVKSDCYAAFDVTGVTSAKGGRVVQCPDGSPCDTDGKQDGTCTFEFTVCVLQAGDDTCKPPDVEIRKRGSLSLPTTPTNTPGCGGTNTVPVKKNKHKTIRLVAHSSGKPRQDRDVLQLQCKKPVPSPSGAFLDDE
jgi:hypothetical protein